MVLIDKVKKICERLIAGDSGWKDLLLEYDINISKDNLKDELDKKVKLQSSKPPPGFEDFASVNAQGIKAGDPAKSLLFHAVASPNVTKNVVGEELKEFPTLEDIDIIENYVYAQKFAKLSELQKDFPGLSVVVFTSEYRSWKDTVHAKHADVCFSRTGVSRVGTERPEYVQKDRGFTPIVEENKHAIRVLPARYSAYLAVEMNGEEKTSRPMRFWTSKSIRDISALSQRPWAIPSKTDDEQRFWIPIHKLFDEQECLTDISFSIKLKAFHVNEKIRKIHLSLTDRTNQLKPESEIQDYPYIFTDNIAEFSADPAEKFGNGVLVPTVHKHLVEEAKDDTGLVSFRVPKYNVANNNTRFRFSSSLEINESGPEYVHVRSKVLPDGRIENLNEKQNDGGSQNIEQIVEDGDYNALHYVDFSADGFVSAEISGDSRILDLKKVSSYSLVTAPDFIPFCNQRELMEWWTKLESSRLKESLWELPPLVLSDSRFCPNLTLGKNIFDKHDVTCTSIVSLPFEHENANNKPEFITHRHSPLPDNAAGVFAPGWDVGTDTIKYPDETSDDLFVTVGYRLGSPFPEDAKLCAALSTFWPAVAPDVSRTFGPTFYNQRNVCPLTDKEIGIDGSIPWDGIAGPSNTRDKVEYTSFEYADYTLNALNDKFSLDELSKIDFIEYTKRIIAMAKVRRHHALIQINRMGEQYSIISFQHGKDVIDEMNDAASNFATMLQSPYRFRVCTYSDINSPNINHDKSTFTIKDNFTIFANGDLKSNQIWTKKSNNGNWITGTWESEQIIL